MYNYAYNLCIIRTYSALIPPGRGRRTRTPGNVTGRDNSAALYWSTAGCTTHTIDFCAKATLVTGEQDVTRHKE